MAVRVAQASTVFLHHVPPAAVERFLAIEQSFATAVEQFPGYESIDIYPPTDPASTEWAVVMHFTDAALLQTWLASSERAELVAKVQSEIGEFQLETLANGFATWFTNRKQPNAPPGWKMVLVVLLGLYPTVMTLTLTVGRVTFPLGLALAILIGNALSVITLQYIVMPRLTRIFGPWLQGRRTLAGALVIAGLLAGLATFFHWLAG